jgi:hypothetical protein
MKFFLGTALLALLGTPSLHSDPGPPRETRERVQKALQWLAGQQAPEGSWQDRQGTYPTAFTALAGTAFLLEGSTPRQGRYRDQLRKAVAWYLDNAQPNGLLVPATSRNEQGRYMLGHGFGLLFLACIFHIEEDVTQRRKLEAVLDRAVDFAVGAQTSKGGWGYVSARDGNDFEEGNATVTVLQGLLAAHKAGIAVPRAAFANAADYHRAATNREGGLVYSLATGANGPGRPIITSAAAMCGVLSGQRDTDLMKRWLGYVIENRPRDVNTDMSLLHHFYLARLVFLRDAPEKDPLAWKSYRESTFDVLLKRQTNEGSWPPGTVGAVFSTSLALIILQLEEERVPFFAR